MSWAANTVLRTGNPGKNGKTRVVEMSFDRVMYKGLGNFVWKTLQSGIVGSITPTGKTLRQEETISSKQAVQEKSKTQEESSKKRKNKKKNSD